MRYKDIGGNIELIEGYIDPNEDEFLKADPDDTRKPKLTLKMINKLKKIRATNDLENLKKESLLGVMYGIPEDDEGGDF